MRRSKQLQETIVNERKQGKLEEGGRIPGSREPNTIRELQSSFKGVKKCAEKCKHGGNQRNVVPSASRHGGVENLHWKSGKSVLENAL